MYSLFALVTNNYAAIQSQISSLPSLSSNPSGEFNDAIDHILACISRLSTTLADAGQDGTIPAHDQRVYGDAVKELRRDLDSQREKAQPAQGQAGKKRFTFKKRTPGTPAVQGNDSRKLGGVGASQSNAMRPEQKQDGRSDDRGGQQGKDYNAEISRSGLEGGLVRRPSFSSARSIALSSHSDLHIILPASASHATSAGQLTDLKSCVVDMSIPTAREGGTPFASLALKNIQNCLIVAGHVDGSVHVTGVKNSVVVVVARQVRIHECEKVDFYLHVVSHPIIEDCKGVRFAPAPKCFLGEKEEKAGKKENMWNEVDDFKWLKEGVKSPNWAVLERDERVGMKGKEVDGDEDDGSDEWVRILKGDGGRLGREDILKEVGVRKE